MIRIARRVSAHVERLVEEETEIGGPLEETAASMQEALERAPNLPAPADQLTWSDPEDHHATGVARLSAKVAGFSLRAGQAAAADDREGLERLCRYSLRAPFSHERLSLKESGEVVYALPRSGDSKLADRLKVYVLRAKSDELDTILHTFDKEDEAVEHVLRSYRQMPRANGAID